MPQSNKRNGSKSRRITAKDHWEPVNWIIVNNDLIKGTEIDLRNK